MVPQAIFLGVCFDICKILAREAIDRPEIIRCLKVHFVINPKVETAFITLDQYPRLPLWQSSVVSVVLIPDRIAVRGFFGEVVATAFSAFDVG